MKRECFYHFLCMYQHLGDNFNTKVNNFHFYKDLININKIQDEYNNIIRISDLKFEDKNMKEFVMKKDNNNESIRVYIRLYKNYLYIVKKSSNCTEVKNIYCIVEVKMEPYFVLIHYSLAKVIVFMLYLRLTN